MAHSSTLVCSIPIHHSHIIHHHNHQGFDNAFDNNPSPNQNIIIKDTNIYIPHHHHGPQHIPVHRQGSNPDKDINKDLKEQNTSNTSDPPHSYKDVREQFLAPIHGHHTHTFPCTDGHGHVITRTIECDRENCNGLVFAINPTPTIISSTLPISTPSNVWTFA